MIAYVAVGVGGAVGAMMRYGISQIGASQWPNLAFPLATLLVNWVGCLLMGMLMLGMERAHIAPQWYPLIGAGLLGGFTTFSAFALESMQLWQRGMPWLAVAYIALSVIGGMVAFMGGMALLRTML
jgi:CrcB protein